MKFVISNNFDIHICKKSLSLKKKLHLYLWLKLPIAMLAGLRIQVLEQGRAVVAVKHRWINQNPFKSMYFAVQSMAAELSTGLLLIDAVQKSGHAISMLVVSHQGSFFKKATGRILFSCSDTTESVQKAIDATIATGEGQKVKLQSVGFNQNGEQVSAYEFEWSIKLKSKK